MLTIDGSIGEGGGQILRTSLSLSLLGGRAVRIEKIRAGRKRPGLMRQHLTAVNAAAEISGARVKGATIGSQSLLFEPGPVKPGAYRFSVGTAGSATLVFQTILPPLIVASGPSTVILEGGTHNPFAPPFDFLAEAFVPLLRRMGPRVEVALECHGFYPAGGGRFVASIAPVDKLTPLHLNTRGPLLARRARAIVSAIPRSIGRRELRLLKQKGPTGGGVSNWSDEMLEIIEVEKPVGPGNAVLISLESQQLTELFVGFGKPGLSAKQLIVQLTREVRRYLASKAAVGEYLADQLLLPLAMAGGGSFSCVNVSRHARTNIEIIKQFLDCNFDVHKRDRHCWSIVLTPPD